MLRYLFSLMAIVMLLDQTMCSVNVNYDEIHGQPLKTISVGYSGVWGVEINNSNSDLYYRTGTYDNQSSIGSAWERVNGEVIQVDVGRDVIWAVDKNHDIIVRLGVQRIRPKGTEWLKLHGNFKHVSVSPYGNVWSIDNHERIYHRVGFNVNSQTGSHWHHVIGQLVQISSGQAGVWGVNRYNCAYYREGTYNDNGMNGERWTKVENETLQMKHVSSGIGAVFAVSTDDRVYRRTRLSSSNPTGFSWKLMGRIGRLINIDGFEHRTWFGVNSASRVYRGEHVDGH